MFVSGTTGCNGRITDVDGCQPRERQKLKKKKKEKPKSPYEHKTTTQKN